MNSSSPLSRRQFLRLAGASLGALALPAGRFSPLGSLLDWPALSSADLPPATRQILELVPTTFIDSAGYLLRIENQGRAMSRLPLARTKWNLERSTRFDRLGRGVPWGIVLHWFGDESGQEPLRNYLYGFNSLRMIDRDQPTLPQREMEKIYAEQDPYEPRVYRTSAHFLVGGAEAGSLDDPLGQPVGIAQTQAPDRDGTPFMATHAGPLDVSREAVRKQYFIGALNELEQLDSANHSLLQDLYADPETHPNRRTIGIEICGAKFDEPDHFPSQQQVANVVSIVWALMQRYGIPASNILGHHEINPGKPDPGKKFLALIRHLIGAKALVEPDVRMRQLVFGRRLGESADPHQGLRKYFDFNWDYLALTSTQKTIYEWEAASKHWFLVDLLSAAGSGLKAAGEFCTPTQEASWSPERVFLDPGNHEGIDLFLRGERGGPSVSKGTAVRLVASGRCVYVGATQGCAAGKTLMFRHRQTDGAEVISVFSHLGEVGNIQAGKTYEAGQRIGWIEGDHAHKDPFLHFAVAYSATWLTDLHNHPEIPRFAKEDWIRRRYLPPLQYLQERVASDNHIFR